AKIMATRSPAQDLETARETPVVVQTFQTLAQSYLSNPQKLAEAQFRLWEGYSDLWQNSVRRMLGEATPPVADAAPSDRRFKDPDWEQNQVFNFLKQAYLITSRWAGDLVTDADGLDDRAKRRAAFFVEQFTNALSPT